MPRFNADFCHVRREIYTVAIEAKDPAEAALIANAIRERIANTLTRDFETSGSNWHLVEDGVEVTAVNVETKSN